MVIFCLELTRIWDTIISTLVKINWFGNVEFSVMTIVLNQVYYPELDGKEGQGLQRQKPHAFHMIVQVHGSLGSTNKGKEGI